MKLSDLKPMFIREFYRDRKTYLRARKEDYCKVQFAWSCWLDGICKDGVITERQWSRATF